MSHVEYQLLLGRKRAEDDRMFYAAGIVAATLANVFRGEGQSPYRPEDFIPKPAKRKRAQTLEEQLAAIRRWAGAGPKR